LIATGKKHPPHFFCNTTHIYPEKGKSLDMDKKVRKVLDRLVKEKKITGYAQNMNKIVLFVKSKEDAEIIRGLCFEGYEIEIIATGEFIAL
jgi:hypothetical protein